LSTRPRLFLSFTALCISPLLALSLISLRSELRNTEALTRVDLDVELADIERGLQTVLRQREKELSALARGPVHDYLLTAKTRAAVSSTPPAQEPSSPSGSTDAAYRARSGVLALLDNQKYYTSIACFDPGRQQLFLAESSTDNTGGATGAATFRTKDFLPGQIEMDESFWQRQDYSVRCNVVPHPSGGALLRCSVPVATQETTPTLRGVLVADLRLDALVSDVAGDRRFQEQNLRTLVVLDSSGRIVYHPIDALKYQMVGGKMPYFQPVAASMLAWQSGSTFYDSPEGDKWIEVHAPVKSLGVSLAVARNYSVVSRTARWTGWLEIALSILIGLVAAALLSSYVKKKTQRIEQVTKSVAAIAGGNLNQRVEAPTGDDMRPIADSVNVIGDRLRDQMAREAEEHQFQSFVKLSALLTHDLKNAIESLSLTVSNMDRHFDNPEFRRDAMNGLASSTEKLRALVARVSNPVNTLSGEFKVPRPTDLIPLLTRVLSQIAAPLSSKLEIEVKLPASLFAMADGERIEKVMENLVLNAIESMSEKGGKLTVAGGTTTGAKVFFSVTDTGVGMNPEFVQQRLFRPFATTKKRGVGLGLYTCREVVRANGGTIEVDSVEGSGTTFRVVLASAQPKERA
jgi:signal transduction histidine kinase